MNYKTLYLYDNIIAYIEKEELKEQPFKYLKCGKIIDLENFKIELEKFLVIKHWLSFFKTPKFKIIIPCHYSKVDKYLLTMLFNDLGLYPTYFNEIDLYTLNKDDLIYNVHNTHIEIISSSGVKTIETSIFKDTKNALDYLMKQKKKKINFFLIGNNEIIESYVKEKLSNTIYYYEEPKKYLISRLSNDWGYFFLFHHLSGYFNFSFICDII